MPQYMLPTSLNMTADTPSWLHFLPWPHLRELLLSQPSRHYDPELDQLLSRHLSLCWPFDLNDAVVFDQAPDLLNLVPGNLGYASVATVPATGAPSCCKCSAPRLTTRFKSQLAHIENWTLKPAAGHHALRKYPEFVSVMR